MNNVNSEYLLNNNNPNHQQNQREKANSFFSDIPNQEYQYYKSLFDQRSNRLCFWGFIIWFTYFYPLIEAFMYFDSGADEHYYMTFAIFGFTVTSM